VRGAVDALEACCLDLFPERLIAGQDDPRGPRRGLGAPVNSREPD